MTRLVAVVFVCLLAFPAQAHPCWLVKLSYAPFAKHGIKAAEKWARSKGYSEAEIKEARKCLSR